MFGSILVLLSNVAAQTPPMTWVDATMITKLAHDEEAEWRAAQKRVAQLGPVTLEALDRVSESMPEHDRVRRIKPLLEHMLRTNTEWADISRYDYLRRLLLPEVRRGFELSRALGGEEIYRLDDSPQFQEIQSLGGAAVPAGVQLINSGKPVAQAYGVAILSLVCAKVARPVVRTLVENRAAIPVAGSYTAGVETLSKHAKRALQTSCLRPKKKLPLELKTVPAS